MASEKAPPEDSAPELATAHDAPEVFRGHHSKTGQPYDTGLEVYHPSHATSPEVAPYYAPHEKQAQLEHDAAEQRNYPYGGVNGGGYTSYRDAANDETANGQDGQYPGAQDNRDRRICGLRRKAFFIVAAIIAALVILAIVLGAALGTTLGSDDDKSSKSSPTPSGPTSTMQSASATAGPTSSSTTSSSSPTSTAKGPPSIEKDTGLSIDTESNFQVLYNYYQDPQGRIVENKRVNGKWSVHADQVPASAVVATNARKGTPLQVISYPSGLSTVRQMFYVASDNLLMTTDTSSGEWASPYNILTSDNVVEDSVALSAVVDTNPNGLNGIRVYYSSFNGYIQEVGRDFNVNPIVWNEWASFPGSDVKSGVATVYVSGYNHLYMLNTSTNSIQQWTWNYVDVTDWKMGVKAGTDMASGSDLAVVNNKGGNDYIFYNNDEQELLANVVTGGTYKQLATVANLGSNSMFAAKYWAEPGEAQGPLVFFRAANNTDVISWEILGEDGSVVASGHP